MSGPCLKLVVLTPAKMRLHVGRSETATHGHASSGVYLSDPRSTPDRPGFNRKSQLSRRTSDNATALGTRIACRYKGYIWRNERQGAGGVLSAHCKGFRCRLGFSDAIQIGVGPFFKISQPGYQHGCVTAPDVIFLWWAVMPCVQRQAFLEWRRGELKRRSGTQKY
jgi:hypothetical protein